MVWCGVGGVYVEKSECVCACVCSHSSAEVNHVSVVCVSVCHAVCSSVVRDVLIADRSPEVCAPGLQMSCIRISALLCSVTQPLNTRLKTTVKYLSPLTNVLFSKETFFYVWPQMSKHEKRSIIPLSLPQPERINY